MTEGQYGALCPQCGSAAAVHSIEELVALTKSRMDTQQQMGAGGQPQGQGQGWNAEPQAGPVGGSGWQPGGWQGGSGLRGAARDVDFGGSIGDVVGEAIGGIAVAAAGSFLAKKLRRRMEAVTEKVMPTIQARNEAALATQTAIAQKYPGLRACTTDSVIFLAGGTRTVPMSNVNLFSVTMEQADALVASLQG